MLDAVSDAWRTRRDEVLASSTHIVGALREATTPPPHALTTGHLDAAAAALRPQFDSARGGFGRAPKFPPSLALEFLLRHHGRTGDAGALEMVDATCTAMARGGIYDQLAGGFARYAVDIAWVVPHFEKMLYDNALLTRVYAHWWRATGSPLAERVARETADFLVRDLGTSEGGFASALDADAAGVEGLTYAWSRPLLDAVLGADDGERAADLLRVTDDGTFEDGLSTLQLPVDPADPVWWADVRSRLLTARAGRPQPGRDDKVVTAWNGLAVAALADLGSILGEPRYVEAATRAATFLVDTHLVDGRLRRSSRDGLVGNAVGVADDYGDLAEGLLALHQATADPRWLAAAGDLLDTALRHFAAGDGGFHDTADDAEPLFTRPRASGRQRRALRDDVPRRSAAHVRRPHRLDPAPRRGVGSDRRRGRGRGAEPAVRRAGPSPSPRPVRPDPSRSRWSDRARTLDALVAEARAATSPGLVRWPANPTRPAYPCWRTGRSSTVGRPPTSAGDSSATARPPTPPSCVGSFRPRTSEPRERCARTLLAQRRHRRTGPWPRRPPTAACPPRRSSSRRGRRPAAPPGRRDERLGRPCRTSPRRPSTSGTTATIRVRSRGSSTPIRHGAASAPSGGTWWCRPTRTSPPALTDHDVAVRPVSSRAARSTAQPFTRPVGS